MYDVQTQRDWGKLPVIQQVSCPRPAQLQLSTTIGQLSCRDACQAYRPITNQAEKWQQDCPSPRFFLLPFSRITGGD